MQSMYCGAKVCGHNNRSLERGAYEKVKQRHAAEVSVWKETSRGNADSIINNVKVAKADIVKMSVERNLIRALFGEHFRALQTLVIANPERKVTLTDSMANIKGVRQ